MRKLAYTVFGTVALIVALSSIAQGATASKCGNLYQPKCVAPTLRGVTITTKCEKPGTSFKVPAFTVTAVAGIKRITVTIHSKTRTILTLKNLHGAVSKRINGLTVNTAGLGSGAHTITIKVVDLRNKTTTMVLPFAVCKTPRPPFTG